MEEKLELVKKMMELEKEKRSKVTSSNQGTLWRSATTKQGIKGYSDSLVTHHKKVQPTLPPTTKVTETRTSKPRIQSGLKRPPSGAMRESQVKAHAFVSVSSTNASSVQSSSKINQNLFQAMRQQSEEFIEVSNFLGSIKLEKYFDKLVENGVEDLDTILELQEEHIEQMGIPLGHKLKIMKKIKDLKCEKGVAFSDQAESVEAKPPQPPTS